MTNLNAQLADLYNDASKHALYQNIPDFVREKTGYYEEINETWRGDKARYQYILNELNALDIAKIIDIGANTGFFTLSLAHKYYDKQLIAYELNENHCNFIKLIIDEFHMKNVVVRQQGVCLHEVKYLEEQDCGLFLNVLHHAGVDFDQEFLESKEDFAIYATQYLFELRKKMKFMFFQLGYNWGGNKQNPLATNINEMMELTADMVVKSGWKFKQVAIYGSHNGEIKYRNVPAYCIDRLNKRNFYIDSLFLKECGFESNSEFYKRPIFLIEKNESSCLEI